jgi:hypothetical protein
MTSPLKPRQSSQICSVITPQITVVGRELDHERAALHEHLYAPVPAAPAESWANPAVSMHSTRSLGDHAV